jgi:hypothetical protein
MDLDKKSEKKDVVDEKENTIKGMTKVLFTFIMMGSYVNT